MSWRAPKDSILKTNAILMTPTQFLIPCACKKKYHLYGNCLDSETNRTEHRCMECPVYYECIVEISEETQRVKTFPKDKKRWIKKHGYI